jgi:hypothetical protein
MAKRGRKSETKYSRGDVHQEGRILGLEAKIMI